MQLVFLQENATNKNSQLSHRHQHHARDKVKDNVDTYVHCNTFRNKNQGFF